jgi:hypothetical protein
MPQAFTVSFQGDPVQLVNQAKQIAAQNHVQFDGNEHSGTFSGDGVAGTYSVQGQMVTVTINRKPFFITMAMIESHMKQFFGA